MIGLISVIALGAITNVGSSVNDLMSSTSDSMASANSGSSGGTSSAGPTPTPGPSPIFSFTSHTFNSCGLGVGPTGPSLSACQTAYAPSDGNWDEDPAAFDVTGGIQFFTIPETGTYRIEAAGAHGGLGAQSGGQGVRLSGEFNLTQGTELKILVGQDGVDDTSGSSSGICEGGGGGGSFVALTDNTPLIVAGGGGGGSSSVAGRNAVFTEDAVAIPGGASSSSPGSPGTGGNGGTRGTYSAAGAGFLTDGQNSTYPNVTNGGGKAFVNGGEGGTTNAQTPAINGGFGGGAGGHGHCAVGGGGGGGYSGGAGPGDNYGGGGGASYNAGSNPTDIGLNSGTGYVTITKL
ncbi:MAG: hypothetical protein Alpg2KO_27440 [Alphaproteobacteria bacterium]